MYEFEHIPTRYNVVTMEPTIVVAEKLDRLSRWRLARGNVNSVIDRFHFNEAMCRWIAQQGYTYSMPTEVWGFDRPPELWAELCERIESRVGHYIREYVLFDSPQQAYQRMLADPSIYRIYDADVERIETWWKMHGFRVLEGGTP